MSRKKNNYIKSNGYGDRYWQTANYNERMYLMLRDDIINLALSRFRWVNLPETCNERYLEYALLMDGCATIARPPSGNILLSLNATQYGNMNMYNEPARWRARGANGRTQFMVSNKNGVFIYDNLTRYPVMSKINLWARELADIIRVKQINRFHQRIPLLITGPEMRQFDMTNILKQITQGELAVITNTSMSDIDIKAQPTEIPFIGENLQSEYENTWNNVYKMLGIDNLPFKAERRIEDEVTSTKEPTELSALSPLECRRNACEKLNKRFGLGIDVVWRHDNVSDNYNIITNLSMRNEIEGGEK